MKDNDDYNILKQKLVVLFNVVCTSATYILSLFLTKTTVL